MIKPTKFHTFTESCFSTASGLTLMNHQFYFVADDDSAVVVVDKNEPTKSRKIHLIPGAAKADLASLVGLPSGDLLCIPSGSEKHQSQGVLIKASGEEIKKIDFSALFSELRKTFSELNIEGVVFIDECLRLFQRGNGKKQQNGTVDVYLKDLLEGKVKISFVKYYELGKQNGANLSFTNATMANNRIYFLAVAEADGEYKGSVLGTMDLKGKLMRLESLDLKSKPEGLSSDAENFYVVTNDNDRSKPSCLFIGKLSNLAK